MKIIVCLELSSYTEKVLGTIKALTDGMKAPEITVLHIIDKRMFYSTTGAEPELGEQLTEESTQLKKLCEQYLGAGIHYLEEYGIPKLKIEFELMHMSYDLLIVGSHSAHNIGERLLGGVAEHLLQNSTKPVLIIP